MRLASLGVSQHLSFEVFHSFIVRLLCFCVYYFICSTYAPTVGPQDPAWIEIIRFATRSCLGTFVRGVCAPFVVTSCVCMLFVPCVRCVRCCIFACTS